MAKSIKKQPPEPSKDLEASYFPVNIESLLKEWRDGEQMGEKSFVGELDEYFRWMPGTINAWYGWANDGKGTFFDFMSVMKSKNDGTKWCFMKQEDMSSTKYKDGTTKVTANRIHKGLVWTKTGFTPYRMYAEKHKIPQIKKDLYIDALEWVDEHYKIISPKDRRFKNVIDLFKFHHEKHGCTGFLIDPFKSLKLSDEASKSQRGDWMLDDLFIECKEFAQETNSMVHFIAHPKSVNDVKDKEGRYKVVNQFMIAGGAAWDNNMDAQYSIYRPERHLNPSDPKVHFHNLKQRNSEEVLAKRGDYELIKFNPLQRRYYFDGICPIDGEREEDAFRRRSDQQWSAPEPPAPPPITNPDELPF